MAKHNHKVDNFGVKTTGEFPTKYPTLPQLHPPVVWNRRGLDPKVLFVYHNDLEDGFIHPALAILGGQMEANGINHMLYDTSFKRDINSPLKESVRELRERIGEEKAADYTPTRKLVDLAEDFRQTVEEFRPDLIALSSTSYDFNAATAFILPAKKEFGIPVIVGGPHAMVAPERAIANPAIDVACVGEGEVPLLELIQRINTGDNVVGINSLWFKDPDSEAIYKNPKSPGIESLDSLPLPDWGMFDKRHIERPWMGKARRQGYIEISRGCPFKCSYCIQPTLHDIPSVGAVKDSSNYIFHKDAEAIVTRIKKLQDTYNFDHMQLIDENMPTMPLKDLEELAGIWNQELNKPDRPISFFTMSRPEYLANKWPAANDDAGSWLRGGKGNSTGKAELLASMGCSAVAMGAESGNEWFRTNVLNRPMQKGILEAGSEVLMSNGIHVSLYNIVGFPFETREMMFDTIDQLWRIKPDRFSVRHLTPYPGTPIRTTSELHEFIDPLYEDKKGGAKSFLHEPVLNLPGTFSMERVQVPIHDENGNLTGMGPAYHPYADANNNIHHPSKAEQMTLRKLVGIYAFSPTKEMWPIIELAEDRGLSRNNPGLQDMVYESFAAARFNHSEDDDISHPEQVTDPIAARDIPWANGDADLYVGRPRSLLPVIELAAGRGYAKGNSELASYVKGHFEKDHAKRAELGFNLSETLMSASEAQKYEGKAGMMVS